MDWLRSKCFIVPVACASLAIARPTYAASSSRPGWGSIPYSGGVTFRVWAPNATNVTVGGTFNGFITTANPLFQEGSSGVWSVDVTGALAGHEYKYYINGSLWKQDPRCRKEVSSAGNSIIYNTTNFNWAGDSFTAPGLSDAVVYELHIGTFNDTNPSDVNPGTFATATNRLAYLKQLGVSVVEVMPIAEFPNDDSWGYNPADIFGVESAYGGPDAFKNFVKTAHQLGLAVIVDVVHNHYGPDLDLWQFDGWSACSCTNGDGGIYFYQTPVLYTTPYGTTRPNYGTQQVRNFIQDSFTMLLDEYHVDGFRWDAPGYMVHDNNNNYINDADTLIRQISTSIHTGYVGKINIGEDQNQLIATGTNGFDATWNGNVFFNNVGPQLTASSDSSRNMSLVDYAVNLNHQSGQPGSWGNVIFTESHDLCGDLNTNYGAARLTVRIDSGNPTSYFARKRSTLGAALALTTPGIPMILQGQEMLTTNLFSASTNITAKINWSLTNTHSGIVSLYTDLIRLRRNLDGRTSGLKGVNVSTIFLQDNGSINNGNNKVIAYRRWDTGASGDDVIVICNFANTSWTNYDVSGFPKTGVWYTQLNSDWIKYGSDYGNFGSLFTTVAVSTATLNIPPYSALILSQNLPGAPPTPQNFTASNAGTNQISLVWNASSGSTGYLIKRGGSQIATTSSTNYLDTGLGVGAQYCYTVAATNFGGVSADSVQACATSVPATGATNLLAYWTFNEGAGTTASDSSGNINTGIVSNSPSWTSGMFGSAIHFSGQAQVAVSNSASLNPVNGITLSALVNPDNWSNFPRILEKGSSSNQYSLFVNPSGQLAFALSGVANGTLVTTPPSVGNWHHVAGTYDGSLISLYVDGQIVTQQTASGQMPLTVDPLAIGFRPGGNLFNYFQGIIDDVRIYGSALTSNQIAQLYVPNTPANLTATPIANQIDLAWSTSSLAASYVVKRGGTPIATTAATNYTDSGLVVGTQYCYTVAATNFFGISPDSGQVCATIPLYTTATNLLAYWTLNEGSGTIGHDSSGNGNTGTVSGSGSWYWTDGMIGSALYFGAPSQVAVSNSFSLNPVQGITVSAWVNADDWPNNQRILEKGKSNNQYALFVNPSGQLAFAIYSVTNGMLVTSPPSGGSWHHIAGTYDGSLISLYVDGQIVTQQTASGQMPVTADPLAIGFRPGANIFHYFNGIIDDVRIYGSALSAAGITQVYNADSVGDGIANWWRLQYFGSSSTTSSTSCATCDADGTGQNNLFKYVAGLNPFDPTSVFVLRIAAATNQSNAMNLTFSPLATGRTYEAQFTTDLLSGTYINLSSFSGPVTNGNKVTITDLNATASNKFYRIHISTP
jgi:1,4-alpha-glucan branching enzyme